MRVGAIELESSGQTKRRVPPPFYYQYTARRGACGKPRAVPHTRPSKPEPMERGRARMGCYVLDFQEIDETQVAVVGGKGAHLGSFRGSKASACRLAFA